MGNSEKLAKLSKQLERFESILRETLPELDVNESPEQASEALMVIASDLLEFFSELVQVDTKISTASNKQKG